VASCKVASCKVASCKVASCTGILKNSSIIPFKPFNTAQIEKN
jgi:hypothetical protein